MSAPLQKLGDVGTVVMGLSPSGDSVSADPAAGLPLLNGPTEFGAVNPTPRQWTSRWAREAEPGDILFCVRGSTTGRMNVAQMTYAIGRGIAAVRGTTSTDTAYIRYALIDGLADLLSLTSGSVFPNISVGDLKGFAMPWPEEAVRAAIASILTAFDKKIESNQRAAMFIESLFTLEFERTIATEKAEEIPLGQRTSLVKGVSYKSTELRPSRTSLVTLKSFDRSGGYKSDGLKQYTGPYKSAQVVAPGEVVVAQTDLTQGAEVVGRAVRVPSDPSANTLVGSLDVVIVRPGEALTQEYLLGMLVNEAFRQHCRSRTSGTTVLHLASDAISSYAAPVVPLGVQRKFSELTRPLIERLDSLNAESQHLANLRDAILPGLMSGRLRVPGVQEAVA